MKKEYRKIIEIEYNENMEEIGQKEKMYISLIADEGKRIKEKSTGITGTRVDCPVENESDYEEVTA